MAKVFSSLISAAFCNRQWLEEKNRARKLDIKNSRMKMVSIQDPSQEHQSTIGRSHFTGCPKYQYIYIYLHTLWLLVAVSSP